jgi:hypothetical protein
VPATYALIPSPNAIVEFTIPVGTGTPKTYECQVTSAAITMTQNTVNVPATGCQGPSTRQLTPTFALALAGLQDWGQVDSLSQFLWDNMLDDADFSLTLGDAPTPVATGTCQLVPGDFGGDFATPLTFTVTMGITGKPDIAPPVGQAARGAEAQPVEV